MRPGGVQWKGRAPAPDPRESCSVTENGESVLDSRRSYNMRMVWRADGGNLLFGEKGETGRADSGET